MSVKEMKRKIKPEPKNIFAINLKLLVKHVSWIHSIAITILHCIPKKIPRWHSESSIIDAIDRSLACSFRNKLWVSLVFLLHLTNSISLSNFVFFFFWKLNKFGVLDSNPIDFSHKIPSMSCKIQSIFLSFLHSYSNSCILTPMYCIWIVVISTFFSLNSIKHHRCNWKRMSKRIKAKNVNAMDLLTCPQAISTILKKILHFRNTFGSHNVRKREREREWRRWFWWSN